MTNNDATETPPNFKTMTNSKKIQLVNTHNTYEIISIKFACQGRQPLTALPLKGRPLRSLPGIGAIRSTAQGQQHAKSNCTPPHTKWGGIQCSYVLAGQAVFIPHPPFGMGWEANVKTTFETGAARLEPKTQKRHTKGRKKPTVVSNSTNE